LFLSSSDSFAKEKADVPKGIRGTVLKVEDGNISVQCGPEKIKTIQTDDNTIYQIEKAEGKIDDLKEGMHIFLRKDKKTQLALEVYASATNKKGLGREKAKPDKQETESK
jgi:hypothetical protein